jgi:uncharacterized protein (DUF302 family)
MCLPTMYPRRRRASHDHCIAPRNPAGAACIGDFRRGTLHGQHKYGIRVQVPLPYDEAVASVTAALKQEGFGVLTTIDVRNTLKQKLDVDFRRYVILGACNPPLAHRALQSELDVGLLLPCNVIVYEDGAANSVVAAMAPLAMLGLVGDTPGVSAVARGRRTPAARIVIAGTQLRPRSPRTRRSQKGNEWPPTQQSRL